MLYPKLILFWAPRLICIAAILFISLFAADAFSPHYTFWQQVQAFLIHMLPSFLLTAVLIIAWKWELIGGILLLIVGLGFTPPLFLLNYNRNHSLSISISIIMVITLPFIVAGFLFIVNYYRNKRRTLNSTE